MQIFILVNSMTFQEFPIHFSFFLRGTIFSGSPDHHCKLRSFRHLGDQHLHRATAFKLSAGICRLVFWFSRL